MGAVDRHRGTTNSHSVPNDPVVRVAVPPMSAIRPRIDPVTPEPTLRRGLLEPALGDAGALVAHRHLDPVAERPRAAPTPAPPHRRAPPRCRGRRRPRPPARPPRRPAAPPVHRAPPRRRRVARLSRPSGDARSRTPSETPEVDGVLRADQRAQRRLLLTGEAPELGALTAELGALALHQRQHLQDAVVDDARQPRPLGRGGRGALRLVALGRHLLQRAAHETDDRAADHAAGRSCRSWSG